MQENAAGDLLIVYTCEHRERGGLHTGVFTIPRDGGLAAARNKLLSQDWLERIGAIRVYPEPPLPTPLPGDP